MNTPIRFYSEHDQLSNFFSKAFVWRGKEWRTAEHAYQAAKFFETDPAISEEIRILATPSEVKIHSHKYRDQREMNWTKKKLVVMEDILRAKLGQDEGLREMLITTKDRELIENSPTDGYWGCGIDGRGENHLGRLWMKLRSELRTETKQVID